MARWSEIAAAEPGFAAHVRSTFAVRKHATLATVRRDGSPRISGTEVEFADDGEVYLGMMPGSVKARDLQRDARLALHCPTEDPPDDPVGWLGDGKLAGVAVEVAGPTDRGHRFRLDVLEVVLTTIGADGQHLLVQSWHADRGLVRRERR